MHIYIHVLYDIVLKNALVAHVSLAIITEFTHEMVACQALTIPMHIHRHLMTHEESNTSIHND